MKSISVIILLIIASMQIFAQEETLISGELESGGYGGVVVKFTNINKNFGVLVGGEGGWIINHKFVLGGGGYGLVNNIATNKFLFDEPLYLNLGYGGIILQYIDNSDKIFHFTISTLIGGGGISSRTFDPENWDWNSDTYHDNSFFIFEPSFRAMINIASFFRIGAGVSYRIAAGVKYENFKNSDISGPSADIILKFGKF